jgi:hypothetical protein
MVSIFRVLDTLSVGDGHSTEALTDNYLKMRLAGRSS